MTKTRELFTDRPRVSLSDLAKRFALYSYRRMNTACRDRRFHRARSQIDKVFVSAYAIAALEREGLPCRPSLRLSDSRRLRWPRSTIAPPSEQQKRKRYRNYCTLWVPTFTTHPELCFYQHFPIYFFNKSLNG